MLVCAPYLFGTLGIVQEEKMGYHGRNTMLIRFKKMCVHIINDIYKIYIHRCISITYIYLKIKLVYRH